MNPTTNVETIEIETAMNDNTNQANSTNESLATTVSPSSQPLRDAVERAMENYFAHLDGQPVDNIYEMVLSEIEIPLFETVMTYTRGNQSKAARLLGISRGTLRKKLKKYGID